MSNNSKIVRLTAENVKRLQAVEIKPDGNMVVIGGKNGQGKSSVLDSIMFAMAGGNSLPPMPVRRGQERAEIEIELGDLIVRRTFTAASGATTLTVTNKDGLRYPSPQAILDKLTGTLTFDPLAFARKDSDEQAETLRVLVGLDFSEIELKRQNAYDDRTAVNRELKTMEARAVRITPDVPEEEISFKELSDKLSAAATTNLANQTQRSGVALLESSVASAQQSVATQKRTFASLKVQLTELERRVGLEETALSTLEGREREAIDLHKKAKQSAEALVDVDVSPIKEQISKAEETNRQVRGNQAAKAQAAAIAVKAKAASDLTARIDSLDQEKTKLISAAKYPIDGLSVGADGGVTFRDVPLSQASSAEQLKISVAIGLALNPTLRVLLIRDGSLLDDESLAMVAEMASKNDAQVWVERVSKGGEVSVVIEDGRVVGAPIKEESKEPEPDRQAELQDTETLFSSH